MLRDQILFVLTRICLILCSPFDAALFNKEEAIDVINQASKNCEVKKGLVMKTLRAALFGTLNGPDLIQSWVLLSRFSKDRARISRFI